MSGRYFFSLEAPKAGSPVHPDHASDPHGGTLQASFALQLTFPGNHDVPACTSQFAFDTLVPDYVPGELGLPEGDIRLRIGSDLATGMTMPEAPMHEEHRPVPREHEVWLAGQSLHVDTKS